MSKTTLHQFLENGELKGNCLIINVVKKLADGKYIVGDSSGLGLLVHDNEGKELKLTSTIKVVKPLKVNDTTLKCSPKFSPMKTMEKVEIFPTKKELKKIEEKLDFSPGDSVNDGKEYTTFDTIQNLPPASLIPTVTFLVTNVSRIIQTKSGQYQICGIKDIESTKLSINLYDKHINKLEVGKVCTVTKLKKFLIKKNDNYETRLQTTKFTMFLQSTPRDTSSFKNVKVADNCQDGIILGFTNILCYESCAEHWNKVNEEKMCQACGGIALKTQFDFKVEILVESNTTDEDVTTFMAFKRVVKMITKEETEEAVETKLAEYEGRKCTVEYNATGEDDTIVIIKSLVIHE